MPNQVRLSPQEAAAKHLRRTTGAIGDMRTGVERMTESPTAKAADKRDKWIARLTESATQDKWERNLRAYPLEQWKRDMIDKGINRVASGLEAAQAKVTNFYEQLFAYENTLLNEINRMPDLTLEDSIQRMSAWVRGMSNFRA